MAYAKFSNVARV